MHSLFHPVGKPKLSSWSSVACPQTGTGWRVSLDARTTRADASISRQRWGKGSRPRPSLHSSAASLRTDDRRSFSGRKSGTAKSLLPKWYCGWGAFHAKWGVQWERSYWSCPCRG